LGDFRIELKQSAMMNKASGYSKYIPGTKKFKEMMSGVDSPDIPADVQKKLDILDAMTGDQLANPVSMVRGGGFKMKKEIATKSSQSVESVNQLLNEYMNMKIIYDKLFALRREGKPVPDTWDELRRLISFSDLDATSRTLYRRKVAKLKA